MVQPELDVAHQSPLRERRGSHHAATAGIPQRAVERVGDGAVRREDPPHLMLKLESQASINRTRLVGSARHDDQL